MSNGNIDDLGVFRASRYGGRITHVGLDYGGTLTSENGRTDPGLAMRPVSAEAAAAVRQLVRAGVTLALVSNTKPGQDRRRALEAARIADAFDGRIYLSHELATGKAHPPFWTHVLDGLGISPGGLLVCGNNIDTDVRAPAALGLRAVLLGPITARTHLPQHTTLINRISDLPGLLTGKPTPNASWCPLPRSRRTTQKQGRTHDDS